MSPADSEIAYAKINLALHVRARGGDGYHQIETLFAFAKDGDLLTVAQDDALTLMISGPFAEGLNDEGDNLVLRAARALRDRFGVADGAALQLDKRLPVASGIGGGSADAAAALRLLDRFWKLDADHDVLDGIARGLGADVPACVRSELMRGEGRGDELRRVTDTRLSGMPLLLINPHAALSTARVFREWDGIDRGGLADDAPLAAACAGRNDLEAPARRIVGEIDEVIDLLARLEGVALARMSGSGATCFALFESAACCDAADRAVARERPGWWRLKTALLEQSAVP